MAITKHSRRRHRHRYAAPLGGAFLLLALIGVITVIALSINLTQRVLDNKSQKEEFESLIRPVVMFDPVPFESAESISNANLLMYSMWSALTSEKRVNYTYNEMDELLVPASELDVAVHRLFGGVAKLEHKTFGDYETRYTYDEKTKLYSVPTTAELYVYTPLVTDIRKEGEYYSLFVDYIPPGSAWTASFTGDIGLPEKDKTMVYVMTKQKDGWHIIKVQDPPPDPNSVLPAIRG